MLAQGVGDAGAGGSPSAGGALSLPPPVADDDKPVAGGSPPSPTGGWRQRAAQKAARLRAQAEGAMKEVREQVDQIDVTGKVASAASAAAGVKDKAAKAFTELTLNQEPGVNAVMATREDFTLQELVAEQDFVAECGRGNKKLLKFLCSTGVLMELVGFVVNTAKDDDGLLRRYQLPFVAAEALANAPLIAQFLLTTEGRPCLVRPRPLPLRPACCARTHAQLVQPAGGSEGAGRRVQEALFTFVEVDPARTTLDSLLCGYFAKVVLGLFDAQGKG